MIALPRLLKLQWFYIILGVGYNIISYIIVMSGGQQLSTTEPLSGGIAMMMYGLFLISAYKGQFRLYRMLMFFAILIFGWGGIGIHLVNYTHDPSLYASLFAWILAVGINVYGILLSGLALFGRFVDDRKIASEITVNQKNV